MTAYLEKQNQELKHLLKRAIQGKITTDHLIDSSYLICGGDSVEMIDDVYRSQMRRELEGKRRR